MLAQQLEVGDEAPRESRGAQKSLWEAAQCVCVRVQRATRWMAHITWSFLSIKLVSNDTRPFFTLSRLITHSPEYPAVAVKFYSFRIIKPRKEKSSPRYGCCEKFCPNLCHFFALDAQSFSCQAGCALEFVKSAWAYLALIASLMSWLNLAVNSRRPLTNSSLKMLNAPSILVLWRCKAIGGICRKRLHFAPTVIFQSPSLLLAGEGKPAAANLSVNIDFPNRRAPSAKQTRKTVGGMKSDTQQKVNQISNFCSPLSALNINCVAHADARIQK